MLQEPFEIRIEDSIINWQFCLKDENDPKMDYTQVPEQKRSLNDLIKDFNYQIQLKLQQLQKRSQNPQRARRKLAKNMLKSKGAKLSQFASQVNQEKQQLKKFFKKQQLEADKKTELSQKIKDWLQPILMHLPREETQCLSKKFIKGYFKEDQNKSISSYIDDIYLIFMDKFIPESKALATESSNLIEIDLNLSIEDRAITDSFLWDPQRTHQLDIWMYTKYLLNDLLLEYDISPSKQQFDMLHEQTRIQLRMQIQYKVLLQKYKSLLVSFVTLQTNQIKQYTIPIEIRVIDNDEKLIYSDDFQWDILNENNNIQQFSEMLVRDQGIPQQFLSQISQQIRAQIYNELNWRFICLSNTFKSLLKQRQLPKLKNQATGQIKKNIIYTLDLPLPLNPDYQTNKFVDFHNSEMFNVLSKNYDLLSKQYQSKVSLQTQTDSKSQHQNSQQKIEPFKIQGHPYLPTNLLSQFDRNKVRSIYNQLIGEK